MTFPSRTPEARRAEYLRNKERAKAWGQRNKNTLNYAVGLIMQETGLPRVEVTSEMAEAKLAYVQALRAIRHARHPVVCASYEGGKTVREVADEFGMDRETVSALLRHNGIVPKRRPRCKYGHEYESDAITKEGWRRCRLCARRRASESYARKRAREA